MTRLNFAQAPEQIQRAFTEESYKSFSRLCVDTVKGTQVKYSAAEANKEILHQIRSTMGLLDEPTIYDVKKALKRSVNREAMFAVIEEVVEDTLISGWQTNPYFNALVEYKTLALGDSNSFYVPSNMDLIVSEVAASNNDIVRQRIKAGTTYTVKVNSYSAKFYMEAERFLMGAEDWADLVMRINKAFTDLVYTLIHDGLMSTASSLPAGQWNLTIQLAEANRAKLVKILNDVSIATGTQAAIYGTAVALSGLQNMVSYNIMAASEKEDIYATGRIGHFGQYSVVEIPQAFVRNDTTQYLYDESKLLILPGNNKIVKMYDEGSTEITDVNDRATHIDGTYDEKVTRKMGVGIVMAPKFGVVNITA